MIEGCRRRVLFGLLHALCLVMALAWIPATAQDTLVIRHPPPETSFDRRDEYVLKLLETALERTVASHGPYRLEPALFRMTQARGFREIQHGRYLDVLWGMTSRQREVTLQPIRIPIYRGLLGVRVLLVSRQREGLLRDVETVTDLRPFSLAQGHDWPDTGILQANGLRVATSSDYDSLFRMVAKGRADLLPRGVTEVWAEEGIHDRHGLTPEPGILLAYPAPNYFFVHPDNTALAERIEQGLESAIADGGFRALFTQHPSIRPALDAMADGDQRIIRLDNPGLPPATPATRRELWHLPIPGD